MTLTVEQRVYLSTVGCGSCGRFGLSLESAHTQHTEGWVKISCPHCAWTIKQPMRPLRLAPSGPVASPTKAPVSEKAS